MATITTNTTDIANLDVQAMRNIVAGIRGRLAASRTIRAQDMLDLFWLYNYWIQHGHNVPDYYWIAFGNTSPRGTTVVTAGSQAVNGAPYCNQSGVGAQAPINTANMKSMVQLVNAIRSHSHLIEDGTY